MITQERQAFEAWLIKEFNLKPHDYALHWDAGKYQCTPTQARWVAWQASINRDIPPTHEMNWDMVPDITISKIAKAFYRRARKWDDQLNNIKIDHDKFYEDELMISNMRTALSWVGLDGYILAPKEPTSEMCKAGREAEKPTMIFIYKAMIKACNGNNNEHRTN